MRLKLFILLFLLFSVVHADFNYNGVHTLNTFRDFKVYEPKKDQFFEENLKFKKGHLTQKNKMMLNHLYSYEKLVRDLLLILSQKYNYNFMQYVAMLTHTQLLTLNAFYKKYDLQKPENIEKVGSFQDKNTQKKYEELLHDSLKGKKLAAELSVIFMKNLVVKYDKTLRDLPKGFKRQLLKTNAFNKKILRMFKKGLRNIDMGLPVE